MNHTEKQALNTLPIYVDELNCIPYLGAGYAVQQVTSQTFRISPLAPYRRGPLGARPGTPLYRSSLSVLNKT